MGVPIEMKLKDPPRSSRGRQGGKRERAYISRTSGRGFLILLARLYVDVSFS